MPNRTKRSAEPTVPCLTAPSPSPLPPRKKKKRRSNVNSPSYPDMPDEPHHITASGSLLTQLNAGHILTRYLHSFPRNPAFFKAVNSYRTVLNPDAPLRTTLPKETDSHQPPPDSLFHCTMTLPGECGVPPTTSTGQGYSTKKTAKRHAAYATVLSLLAAGEIKGDLEPTVPTRDGPNEHQAENNREYIKKRIIKSPNEVVDGTTLNQRWKAFKADIRGRLPAPSPAGANGLPGSAVYPHIATPEFWGVLPNLTPVALWPTIMELRLASPFEAQAAGCRTLCLLTSRSLPIFERGDVVEVDVSQVGVGKEKVTINAWMRLTKGKKMKMWEEGKMEDVKTFTERLMRAQLHKDVRCELETTRWLLVPMNRDYTVSTSREELKVRRRDIDWDAVTAASDSFDLDRLSEQVIDTIATSKSEFSRKSYITTLRKDLSPSSPDPLKLGYTFLSAITPPRTLQHADQPILESTVVHPAKSGGYVASLAFDLAPTTHFSIPELTYRHSISASIFRTSSMLPAFFSALDDLLVAREMNDGLFSFRLKPDLALLALSCPIGHGREVGKTYERLEMLGDTVLKLISTIHMYLCQLADPTNSEELHVNRHLMISNRALRVNAIDTGIVPYIRSAPLRAKEWVPHGWSWNKEGAKTSDDTVQTLGDKTIADVAEALIGAAYLSSDSDIDGAISGMRILGIPLAKLTAWPSIPSIPPDPASRILGLSLLGYTFNDPERARDVLSMSNDEGRLERCATYKFLGDALLDYFVVEALYHQYPEADPASLTYMCDSRCGNASLGAFCVTSSMVDQLIGIPPGLDAGIKKYKREIRAAQGVARDDEEERVEFWAEVVQHDILGTIPEAALGAILLDSCFSLELTRQAYLAHLAPFFERYSTGPKGRNQHPKARFIELTYTHPCGRWSIDRSEINGIFTAKAVVHGCEIGVAAGESRAMASRKACDAALRAIECEAKGMGKWCDCPGRKKGRGQL